MSYIGKNIKKIRTVKKLSQASFAELFNLARPSVGAYEEGRAEPKIETIVQIAHYFGLSIDLLLNKELTVNDLYKFDIIVGDADGGARPDLEKKTNAMPEGGISLVLVDKYLEYIVNYQNKDFISRLEKIYLPISRKEKSRAFQLNGSEMEYNHNGLHHGDILLGYQIETLTARNIRKGKVFVVVTKDNIITRRITDISEQIEFSADDPNYSTIYLNTDEILELWQVYGVYSIYLNPPSAVEARVLKIEDEIREIKKKLK
ncbi:helix-turn-helix transcriptional regulator [Fulvivirgaceae bacterium BMA12]|uniref:Helix-turn-helix transcriptional regulator n=1 Tax=Agaribacillus aureus TaxID=3051825 RepID=A0ABT8L4B4_9BACT|nr:helix-turn-helix transcriptional regulator [Fulvivirgaceae bacterium BMA12]